MYNKKCFLSKAPDIRGVTLRRDSVSWSRAQTQTQTQLSLDGSEQQKYRDSSMATPATHQVCLWFYFLYIHFEFKVFTLVCILTTFSSPTLSFSPIAHFLSLLPVGGNRTTADLMSPVFLPSQTCQVTKPFSLSIMRITDKNLIPIPHLFPPQLSFYHYVGAKHGHLQVFVQSDTQGQITEVWKNSTPLLMETWSRAVITFSSNHSFQVCNIHSS